MKFEVENLIDEIVTQTFPIENMVVIHKTLFPDKKTLKDKVEKKFKVMISNTAEEVSVIVP